VRGFDRLLGIESQIVSFRIGIRPVPIDAKLKRVGSSHLSQSILYLLWGYLPSINKMPRIDTSHCTPLLRTPGKQLQYTFHSNCTSKPHRCTPPCTKALHTLALRRYRPGTNSERQGPVVVTTLPQRQ